MVGDLISDGGVDQIYTRVGDTFAYPLSVMRRVRISVESGRYRHTMNGSMISHSVIVIVPRASCVVAYAHST